MASTRAQVLYTGQKFPIGKKCAIWESLPRQPSGLLYPSVDCYGGAETRPHSVAGAWVTSCDRRRYIPASSVPRNSPSRCYAPVRGHTHPRCGSPIRAASLSPSRRWHRRCRAWPLQRPDRSRSPATRSCRCYRLRERQPAPWRGP